MQNMIRECSPFSKDQPLVLDQQLQLLAASDLQCVLKQVYLNPEVGSASEAHALIRVADLFDAAKLLSKATTYLEEATPDNLFVSKDSIVSWLCLAEQFGLTTFMTKCANQAALHYTKVKSAAKFNQLGPSALKAIMKGLHLLTCVYPSVPVRLQEDIYGGRDQWSAADFIIVRPVQPELLPQYSWALILECSIAKPQLQSSM